MLSKVNLLLTFLPLVATFFAKAQPVNLLLNERITDETYRKTQALMPVFFFKEQPFEVISDFGLKTSKKHETKTFTVTFPTLNPSFDTAYSYLFFGGNNLNEPIGYAFCIISNPIGINGPTLLYIDKNFNNNLQDDGPPDTFYNKPNEALYVKAFHPQIKEAFHLVRLTRFEVSKNKAYNKLVDEHYQKNSGSKFFAGTAHSFREQRLNLKSSTYHNGNDSFRIAVKDVNCNGLFNDDGIDQIYIDHFEVDEIGDRFFELNGKKSFFEWNGKKYSVLKIDPAGNQLQFEYLPGAELEKQLKFCRKIPKFKIIFADPKKPKVKIRKYTKKPMFIYFWDFNSPHLDMDTAALGEIHRTYADIVSVLALNYGDPPRKVFGWQNINKSPLVIGIAPKKIAEKYYVEKTPFTILTNKKNQLCEINLTSQQLLTRLKEKYPR